MIFWKLSNFSKTERLTVGDLMKNIDIIDILTNGKDYEGKSVVVAGWARTARDSKTMAFVALNDGTSLRHLQIVIDKANFDANEIAKCLKNGASLLVTGKVVPAMNQGDYEINAESIELLGDCPSVHSFAASVLPLVLTLPCRVSPSVIWARSLLRWNRMTC